MNENHGLAFVAKNLPVRNQYLGDRRCEIRRVWRSCVAIGNPVGVLGDVKSAQVGERGAWCCGWVCGGGSASCFWFGVYEGNGSVDRRPRAVPGFGGVGDVEGGERGKNFMGLKILDDLDFPCWDFLMVKNDGRDGGGDGGSSDSGS